MAAWHKKTPAIDLRFACYRMRVGGSGIHRFGVYACEPIPARRKVIEYKGEVLTRRQVIRRLKPNYFRYVFRLNSRQFMDANVGGSGAEFINHSCDGCLYSCGRRGHIIFMSRRRIRVGEELTYDYRVAASGPRLPCCCGSPKCRGTINLKPTRVRRAK
jgi:SET domain-containing protein